MICDYLTASGRYAALDPRLAAAFAYLQQAVAGRWQTGRTDIIPDQVWATIVRKPARPAANAGFEYHAQFADIHCCLAGREQLGWRANADGLAVRAAFNADADFGLYEGTPEEFVPLAGARFALFFPGELHAPLIGEGELTKVCVKVRMNPPV